MQQAGKLGELSVQMAGLADAVEPVAKAVGVTTEAFLAGQFTLEEYAASLGLTGDALRYIAEQGDVKLADLFSDDPGKAAAVRAELDGVIDGFDELAASAGLTTQAFTDQVMAAGALIDAHDAVNAAIAGVNSAQEARAVAAQRQADADNAAAAALTAYNEAVAGYDKTGKEQTHTAEDVAAATVDLANAYGDMNTAFAVSGVGVNEALDNQARLREEFIALAPVMNKTEAEAAALFDTYAAFTTAEAAHLTVTGQEEIEAADQRMQDLEATTNRDFIARIAANTDVSDESSGRRCGTARIGQRRSSSPRSTPRAGTTVRSSRRTNGATRGRRPCSKRS